MKKVFWIKPIIFTSIILLFASGCKKEEIATISKSDSAIISKSDSASISKSDSASISKSALPIIFNPNLNYNSVTDIEGNIYKTIQIGSQTWMAENLRTTHYADGTAIPLVTGDGNWKALTCTDKAYCWFNNDSISNTRAYGALYTWAAAMNGAVSSSSNPSGIQGVCPTGWHLPSDNEWTTLTDYLGGLDVAGGNLKETGTNHWNIPNYGATNESGFTAVPGGHRSFEAVWWNLKDYGFWWSSTEDNDCQSWYRVIVSTESTAEMYRTTSIGQDAFSIRCVKGDQYKTVMTGTATNISSNGATLNGYVLANNLSTLVTFEYGTSTSYGQEITAIQSPLDSSVSTIVSAELTDLTVGTYHFRIKAVNSAGTLYSDDNSFSTLVGIFPHLTDWMIFATNVSTNGMTLRGTVNANTFTTTVTFEYGTTESYGDSVPAIQSPVAANTSSMVSAEIAGLIPGTTYYCRIKLQCLLGHIYFYRILVPTFICDQAPAVTILPLTNISDTSVTLNGTINANGLPTTVTFEGLIPKGAGKWWSIPALQSPVTGNSFTNVSAVGGSGLERRSRNFRVKAVNSCGTNYSAWMRFPW